MKVENIEETIMKARPNLKPNTIKMYLFSLNKIRKIMEEDDFTFLKDIDKVKEKLSYLHYTSQRNYFNAIIVLLSAVNKEDPLIAKYDAVRNELNKKYIDDNETGKISDKQAPNFVELSEVTNMIAEMEKDIKLNKLKKSTELSSKQKELLQVYTIYNILLKIPLRNDLAGMRAITRTEYNSLTEDDKKTNNYLVVNKGSLEFILNEYKTSRKYSQKNIVLPKELEKIVRMFLRKNGMGILFTSSTGKPLTRNALSQLLIKTSKKYMNGKSISTTMIRKIVLSDMFAETKKEQEKMAEITGHSTEVMNDIYVKEK